MSAILSTPSWNPANNQITVKTGQQFVAGQPQQILTLYPGGNTADLLTCIPAPSCEIIGQFTSAPTVNLYLSTSTGAAQYKSTVTTGAFSVNRAGQYLVNVPKVTLSTMDTGLSACQYSLASRTYQTNNPTNIIGESYKTYTPTLATYCDSMNYFVTLPSTLTSYTTTLEFMEIANSAHGGGAAIIPSVLIEPYAFQTVQPPNSNAFVYSA